ncbi:MAG TPA: MFS transporter [Bryobacteraceae bacterium]|nr:MFS transporter [Bryobacteraceae bacterium]
MEGTAPVSLRSYWRLLRTNRNFRLLWTAQLISEIGDWLYSVAIYSLLLKETGSARAVAFAFVLQVLPQFFAAPAAGVLNDRLSRKRIMIFSDWARAGITLLMLLGQLPGYIWLLYVLLCLETIGWALFEPARTAVIPNITRDEEEQLAGNGLSSTTWSFTLAVGSALGGLVAAWFGRSATFVLNSLSFVVSGLLLSQMRFSEPHAENLPPVHARELVNFRPVLEGVQYVQRDARLFATMLIKTGLAFIGSNWVLLPVLGEREFPLQLPGVKSEAAGMMGMSVLMGCRGVGALLGPIVWSRISGVTAAGLRRGVLLGFFVGAVGYFLFSMAGPLPAACAAIVLAHSGGSVIWVFSTTMLQMMTEDRFRGRVFSAEYALHTLVLSLVVYSIGHLADAGLSVRTLAAATAVMLAIPGLLWGTALRLWRRSA